MQKSCLCTEMGVTCDRCESSGKGVKLYILVCRYIAVFASSLWSVYGVTSILIPNEEINI